MNRMLVVLLCSLSLPMQAQRIYRSANYGVSFRYPRTYKLIEGPLPPSDPGLGYLGEIPIGFGMPGGTRIATIEAPRNLYPGTDFQSAFLTVTINRSISRSDCETFRSDPIDPYVAERERFSGKISGRTTFGMVEDGAGLGHQYEGKSQHVFLKGSCYDISYGIATGGYGDVDGMKQVDTTAVLRRLERIAETVMLPSGD